MCMVGGIPFCSFLDVVLMRMDLFTGEESIKWSYVLQWKRQRNQTGHGVLDIVKETPLNPKPTRRQCNVTVCLISLCRYA
ncbi:hypothetical protein BDV29DRAFT_186383 [Aspergillus leporis]|uniref:Uncharacterized protein n=1 Tax=Aspergillus leporis TaxID=41062 RepID=A0A5N5WJ60_9EURO|nr:hypothetical protein BDV29DRAFT_186383 [Aspergillus leporis]